jgi:hypothetical protein
VIKRPSIGSILWALVPFDGMRFCVLRRVRPRAIGLPFNQFWIWAWLALTPTFSHGEAVPHRPRITGLSHVALWVRDLGKSRAFYEG